MLNHIENFFNNIRDSSDCSRNLVTIITTIGFSYVSLKLLCLTNKIYQGARLYFFSQYFKFCRTDFVKKYGKWVVISGSTDGIGLAMAKEFARRGHSILIIARNEEKLAKTKETLEQEPNVGEVETIKIDLSDASLENYNKVVQQINPYKREIGILVNNAGVFVEKFERYNEQSLESIKNIVNVNILATALLTRLILPSLVNNGKGLLVNVSSMAGCLTSPYMSVYGPSKSFVNSFSKTIHDEYGDRIDVINLTPGGVQTKLYKQTRRSDAKTDFLIPKAEYYATRAINAMSTGCNSYSGTLGHGIFLQVFKSFTSVGYPIFKHLLKRVESIKELPPVAGNKNT